MRRRKSPERPSNLLSTIGWIFFGAIVGVPISVPLAPWIAKLLSHEPVVNVNVTPLRSFGADCTVFSVLVGGQEMNGVKTLEAEFRFNGPVTSMAVFSGDSVDSDGATVQQGTTSVSPPCNVSSPAGEKLADNVQASVLGDDSRELMIIGHDLTVHSISTILVSVYPDRTLPNTLRYQFDARATYMAFGLELPTKVNRLYKDGDPYHPR